MSRTRRIYNKLDVLRKYKFDVCWIWWHPYKQACTGNCNWCRDPDNDGKIQRKRRGMEFRRWLDDELTANLFKLETPMMYTH